MLNKFSTSAKLYLLIFITAVSLIGLGFYGIDDLKEMNENTRTLYADRVLCMQQLANMRFEYISEIHPMAQKVKEYELTFAQAKDRVHKAREIININWNNYKLSYFTPEEQLLVKQMDVIKSQADKESKNLESILTKGDIHAINDLVDKKPSADLPPFVIKVTELMELQVRVGKEIFNNNKDIYKRTSRNFFLLILLSLLIALPLSYYIIRNIKRLIKDILKSGDIIKENEGKYRQADARFKAIVENVFVGIKLNDSNWEIIYRSPSMQAINGWPDEVMNHDYFKLIHPDDLAIVKKAHQETLINPNKNINIIYRILHKNGRYIWIESQLCNKLSDPDLGAIITVTRDITERKQMEAEIREAEIKFRTLAEKSMVGIYIIQKEKFYYLNSRFAEIFGYQHHELANLKGSIINTIVSKEDQARVRNNVQVRYAGEASNVRYEFTGKRKNGTRNYLEILGSSVIIDGEPSIIGTMIDITERKKAEELTLSEKAISDTIINSLPGIFYLRNKKGEFLRWNKNFETITGYTAEEIGTLKAENMIVKEDRKVIRRGIDKVFSDGYAMVEAKAITKDGTKIPFLFSAASIMYENEQCLLGTGFDISSRIKAAEELRSSEQKYKFLFESNPSPLWMVAKDDLSIIAVNEAAANVYGYTKDELLYTSINKLRPKEDLDLQLKSYQKELTNSTDFGIIRHVKKDGTNILVQVISHDIVFEGRLVRLSLTSDVTEQLKAEESLKKSEANLKTIMDTTDTAYALLDKKLNVMAFNQKAVEFVNSQFNHFPAKDDQLVDYFPKERFPQFSKYAEEVLKGKNISYEINYPQPDGSVFWYYVRLFPITNEKNEILGLMMALSDVTERKKDEESLKTAYSRIQNQMNSIKVMAWKQSHLIRSPLANLKGLTTMLKDDPSDDDVLAFIQNELDRMDAIIIEMAEDASNHVVE